MIETYAFFAMFAVLILTVSVMHMVVLTRFVRTKSAAVPDEYYAQLSPTADRHQSTAQFVSRYRLAQSAIALLGVLLLGWLISYMQRPDWDKRWVVIPVMVYFIMQWLPMVFIAIAGFKHLKVFKSFLLQSRRKATLKRRGLFDFVSPTVVWLAGLVYLLFVAFMLYAQIEPAAKLLFIGAVTFNYLLTMLTLYKLLYGKKSDPFETHAGRLHTIGLRARSSIHTCIAVVFFSTFTVAVMQSDLQRWLPFALAAFLTAVTLLTFRVFTAPPRGPDEDELHSNEVAS
jgi:hypothetical protein